MNGLLKTAALSAALLIGQYAHAQLAWVGGWIDNATYESAVFGVVARSSCTFDPDQPAWTSAPAPAALTSGQSLTWGYTDGSTPAPAAFRGGTIEGNTDPLENVSFRNVIRGANMNGGVASALNILSWVSPTTNLIHLQVWGPTLNNYGVNGAQSFHWALTNGPGGSLIASGDGEVDINLLIPTGAEICCTVTPTDPNTNGSVLVSFDGLN